jgi:hypothetical protein
MTFTDFIRKQQGRDDPSGDFAYAFVDATTNGANRGLREGCSPIESETLFGVYNHLPMRASTDTDILQALIQLWKEFLEYKHIGLKFNKPERGYVYCFQIRGVNTFKIGKTAKDPLRRKMQIEIAEKVELDVYNWIEIDNYSIIESELKKAFGNKHLQKEWFTFGDCRKIKGTKRYYCHDIYDALYLYRRTDSKSKLYKPIEDDEFESFFMTKEDYEKLLGCKIRDF